MRTMLFRVLAAGSGLLLMASPVLAHHWFPRESDQPIPIAGTVTRFEWVNPHARFYIDVRDETGKVRNWEIELGGPGALASRGWSRDLLKIGDAVAVEAFPWKGRERMAVARTVQLADGRKLFAGSHAGDFGTTKEP